MPGAVRSRPLRRDRRTASRWGRRGSGPGVGTPGEFLVDGGSRASWRIGGDLLQLGPRSPSGLGGSRTWPSCAKERAATWLQPPTGDVVTLFELPAPSLAAWLGHVRNWSLPDPSAPGSTGTPPSGAAGDAPDGERGEGKGGAVGGSVAPPDRSRCQDASRRGSRQFGRGKWQV
ncbi:SsgA family sporulation/cell division regulator [Streptomyces sp. NPDC096079]|uniref:SsgA family sporulation/cell division regulator n=1 Tax=Streptomyces sp. NPDC096079 TaxID=3155820 RepID=UPI00332C74B3